MTIDLDATLRDLADGAAAEHRARTRDHDPVLDRVRRRVRRRRRVRGAAVVTSGLAVAAALTVGGLRLAEHPEVPPAVPAPSPTPDATPDATPDPTPDPSRTATPASAVLPAGDPALPFGACGSLASTLPASVADPAYTASVEPLSPSGAAGGALAVRTWAGGSGTTTSLRYAVLNPGGANVSVVRDGVVVATAAFGRTERTISDGTPGERDLRYGWLPLAVCTPDGQPDVSGGAPLPAGSYELLPWTGLTDLGTDDAPLRTDAGAWIDAEVAASLGTPATAVGPATSFTITGTATTVTPPPGAGTVQSVLPAATLPRCGDPAPARDAAVPVEVSTPLSGTTVGTDDLASLTAELSYTGGGDLSAVLGELWVMAVRDDRIVGMSPASFEGEQQLTLAPGIPVPYGGAGAEVHGCAPGEELYGLDQPLAAGTYELVIGVEVMPVPPSATAEGGWVWPLADPATLVVD